MAFRSRRLRVQLPCGEAGSLVERDRFVPEAVCTWFTKAPCDEPESMICAEQSDFEVICRHETCTNGTGCLEGSTVTVIVMAERRTFLSPADLIALRDQLAAEQARESSA
jgi:hypothetical protein